MRRLSIIDSFLIFIFTVCLILLGFFSTIHTDFKDIPSMLSFLKNGRVYENLSSIAKIQIENSYPQSVIQNILLLGIANKIVESIVTPRLIEIAAIPAVTASVRLAKSPAEIIDQKFVVPTVGYKQQVTTTLSSFGLPALLTNQLTTIVNGLPSQITLVDLEKNPNSPVGMLLKARALFKQNEVALSVTWTILVITGILLVLLNLHTLKKLLKFIWVGFGISALVIFILYVLVPWIVSKSFQSASSAFEIAQSKLVLDAVSYFMIQVRVFGIVYVIVFFVCFIVYKFVKLDAFQIKSNRLLKKFHIPTFSVK